MKDVSKYDLQQPQSIEYERQRHITHWLIQSSPHMPKPAAVSASSANTTAEKQIKKQKKIAAGTITNSTPIIFCLNRLNNSNNTTSSSLSKAPHFFSNSQTNLPLQIVTGRDGHKAKIRRFNSHDTSANMFSVADFENARLARRNEKENALLMKQQSRYKMNSLSSGGDYSTGDSKGSKFSNESISDPMPIEVFLDKYSLPRVVRLSYDENMCTDTIASFSSTESTHNDAKNNGKHSNTTMNGEIFLLYRHLKDHKVYHVMNAKASSNRKRGIRIPQDFQGYFSLVNDRGQPTATTYTTIVQLVRERVSKFLSVDSLTAYSESTTTDKAINKSHYVKGTAKAGQVFRLLAVFQDGAQDKSYSSQKDPLSMGSGREKERGRYAQLVGENRQIIYVSLSSKGKFYEIEHQTPTLIQQYHKNSYNRPASVKPVNPDCVHKISTIITPNTELPLNLKYIAGPVGHSVIPETITVHRVSRENVLITCPIDENAEEKGLLHLKKLDVSPNMKLVKCFLGFENEQRMFSNPNVQNIFKFCQFNADDFARSCEQETLPPHITGTGTQRMKNDGLKIRNPLNFLLKTHDKNTTSSSGHEKEDSIIFLSKNDLENMEPTAVNGGGVGGGDRGENENGDEKKTFQPKKRWFKHLRSSKPNSFTHLNFTHSKRDSLDRYQDMSKLIQERFGESTSHQTSPPRPSSEIGYKNAMSDTDTIQKSFSLQDLDYGTSSASGSQNYVSKTPDIVSDSRDSRPQTFISQKLYHEFHVKTRHSKSSSSLHQLIRRQKAAAAAEKRGDEDKYPFEIKFERKDFPMFEPNDRQDDCSLTVLDDLPYSSVRDSIIIQEDSITTTTSVEQPTSSSSSPNDAVTENIYAEIFNNSPEPMSLPTSSHAQTVTTVQVEERNVPNFHRISEINNSTRIRISLFNDDPNQNFTAKI